MPFYKITYTPEEKRGYIWNHGCNFECKGCFYLAKPNIGFNPREDKFLGVEDLKNTLLDLKKKKGLWRVHFLGGEPTIEPRLPELVEFTRNEIHAHNHLITNGFNFPPEGIDSVSMSLKAYTNELYEEYVGRSNHNVLNNFIKIYESGIGLKASTVFIPDYIECGEIEKVAQFIANIDKDITYRVIGYIPVPFSPWRKATREEIMKAELIAKKYLKNVTSSCLSSEDFRYNSERIM